ASEVNSIVFLTSSSVEGLTPENVTVVDTEGRVLSGPHKDEQREMTAALKLRSALEQQLEQEIEALLEPTVGKGHVVASVSVDIDWSNIEVAEDTYDPDKQVVRSEKIIEESGSESSTESETAPGTTANIPQGQTQGTTGTSSSQTQKRTEIYNYEIARIQKKTVIPAGRIKRISAAVLVDGKYEIKEGAESPTYIPRTDEEIKRFTEIVKTAIGYDETRGDQVQVVNVPFMVETPEELHASRLQSPVIRMLIRYGLLALAVASIFLFVVKPLVSWLTAEQEITEEELGKVVTGMTVAEAEKKLEGAKESGESATPWRDRLKELEERRHRMIEDAKRDKKAIVLMIKRWLKEDMT
ncbi:MAG TPA: flagellar M-ring protein FliF, partial [Proteobacteria bacterium]|nr:flagellar M-ring protein FliF [Pseudomonadota bacterium]